MASVTFAIDEQLKQDLEHFSWVNWSNVVSEELTADLKRAEALEKALKIVLKSKFSSKDADMFTEKVKKALHERLKQEGLI